MIRGVHQLIPALYRGDAMGNHTLTLQRLFRSWNFDSKIFTSNAPPDAPRGCYPSGMFEKLVGPDDIALLHYGVYCCELQAFRRTHAQRVLMYHNITPPRFFVNHSLRYYYVTAIGRLQLRDAVMAAQQSWAPSLYSKGELDALGARDCRVVPLLMDFEELDQTAPDMSVLSRYSDGATNILFVGRLAPNKRQEDVIAAFAQYHRNFDGRSRLLLVGSDDGMALYGKALRARAQRFGVEDAVVFTGRVTLRELVAYYRVARIFLCLSEHEGFSVPLVEAMHFGIPIVALARAAVPGTLAGAGILLNNFDPEELAGVMHQVCVDQPHRDRIVSGQRRRLRDFSPGKVAGMIRLYLEDLVS
jgi:glycosyltransferase involved in cell wall biosynthesis